MVQNDEESVEFFEPFDDGCYSEEISMPRVYLEYVILNIRLTNLSFLDH